jgi:hypothetical protein
MSLRGGRINNLRLSFLTHCWICCVHTQTNILLSRAHVRYMHMYVYIKMLELCASGFVFGLALSRTVLCLRRPLFLKLRAASILHAAERARCFCSDSMWASKYVIHTHIMPCGSVRLAVQK